MKMMVFDWNIIYKIYKCNEKNPEIILEDDELLLSDDDLEILKNNKYQKNHFIIIMVHHF